MDDRNYYRRHNYGGVPVLPSPQSSAAAAAATWPCFLPRQEEEVELRDALAATAADLETTRTTAQAELRHMEAQALRLAELLDLAVRERDEARAHCHSLLFLLQQHNSVQQTTAEEGIIAADSPEEGSSDVSAAAAEAAVIELAAGRRNLPEKGRLVEAVMSAGPLLQSLQIAGALPDWNRPPPPLPAVQIPPVNMEPMQQQKRLKVSRRVEVNEDDEVVLVHHCSSSSSPESNGGGGSGGNGGDNCVT